MLVKLASTFAASCRALTNLSPLSLGDGRASCSHCRSVLLVAVFSTCGLSSPPTLSHLSPAGAQRGATVEVACHGEFDWPLKVWSPDLNVHVGEEKGKVSLAIPPDLCADRIWLRLYNDAGATRRVPLVIGNLPETSELEPNDAIKDAQQLSAFAEPPNDAQLTVNGVLGKRDDVDGFALSLVAGQTLVAAVAANSHFGSPMDSIMQIVRPDGTVVAENHDDVGLDPRIAHTATTTGIHIVRLFAFPSTPNQRIQFHGEKSFVYRLTLTTGPYITHTIPAAVTAGEPATVEVKGWNIPSGARLPVVPTRSSEFELGRGTGLGTALVESFAWSNTARIGIVPHPTHDRLAKACKDKPFPLCIPSTATGCISTDEHKDFFQLSLAKNQTVEVSLDALSLESHLVPFVQLRDPGGAVVAEHGEKGAASDAMIKFEAPSDGRYVLSVTDRYRHGGTRYFYRLSVVAPKPDFELSVSSDRFTLTPEQPVEIPVAIKRSQVGAKKLGRISVNVLGLPDGVTAAPAVSEPEGESSSQVSLALKAQCKAWSGPIRIKGVGEGALGERYATTPPLHGAVFRDVWLTITGESGEMAD